MAKMETFLREGYVKTFLDGVSKKVATGRAFTPDEKEATEYISRMVRKWGASLQGAGRKRDDNPSLSALYLRSNRAQKAVEAAEAAGATGYKLRKLRSEAKTARDVYQAAKAADQTGGAE